MLILLPPGVNCGGKTYIFFSKLSHHWFRKWLVACSAPSNHLNQWWLIINSSLRNKILWNTNRNVNIFIKNAFENVVCKMADILSRSQCFNPGIMYCVNILGRGGGSVCIVSSAVWLTICHCQDIGHDDVIKWKHFPRYWPFVRGIHRSPVNSPHKGQWRGALMFSLIYAD